MIAEILLSLAAGAAVGTVYFLLLERSARAIALRGSVRLVAALIVARVAAAVGLFVALAFAGALPLLLGFAAFLAARQGVLIWVRRGAANG
ncbi:MAG: hypothetical protein KIT16_14565 [Rhodospirillaceae bacterium]|nr:hypothetical protein [Rhodospirillaceae bacterium]